MEITKEQFDSYNDVRESGVTNMFNVTMVCDISGLTKEEVMNIMKNYSVYSERWD